MTDEERQAEAVIAGLRDGETQCCRCSGLIWSPDGTCEPYEEAGVIPTMTQRTAFTFFWSCTQDAERPTLNQTETLPDSLTLLLQTLPRKNLSAVRRTLGSD